jgi:hypothetical protein
VLLVRELTDQKAPPYQADGRCGLASRFDVVCHPCSVNGDPVVEPLEMAAFFF